MKVLVCGAGQVGTNIARYLAMENNDVTIIDQTPELIRRISDSLDVKGIVGHASHPDSLLQADAANAETLFQPDRIHPTAAAHPIILDNVWPHLKRQLK